MIWLFGGSVVRAQMTRRPEPVTRLNGEPVYDSVDRRPRFPGGGAALSQYLLKRIRIPNSLVRAQYDPGKVYVNFIVDRNGGIHDIRVEKPVVNKTIEKGMDEYVVTIVTAVEKMPNWIPGQLAGQPVAVLCRMPVQVSIQ